MSVTRPYWSVNISSGNDTWCCQAASHYLVASDEQDLFCHMATLGHNELSIVRTVNTEALYYRHRELMIPLVRAIERVRGRGSDSFLDIPLF